MIEQYIQLLKTNPAAFIGAQAVVILIISVMILVQIIVMVVMCTRLKKQTKRIDTTLEKANQYLEVIMNGEDYETEEIGADTVKKSAGSQQKRFNNHAENLSKNAYVSENMSNVQRKVQEDQNRIISAVLDEVFQ